MKIIEKRKLNELSPYFDSRLANSLSSWADKNSQLFSDDMDQYMLELVTLFSDFIARAHRNAERGPDEYSTTKRDILNHVKQTLI